MTAKERKEFFKLKAAQTAGRDLTPGEQTRLVELQDRNERRRAYFDKVGGIYKAIEEDLKEYIDERKAFNKGALARLIGMDISSFHQWTNGKRPLPEKKRRALITVLNDYGYSLRRIREKDY